MKKIQRLLLLCTVFYFAFTSGYSQDFDGYVLYNKLGQNTAYLLDKNGTIAHSWTCARPCNYSLKLKPNGNIVRGAVNSANILSGAAVGGTVQEIDPSGNVIWTFNYSDANHVSHHDLALVGDNVLLIAWEKKTSSQMAAAGYTGSGTTKYVCHIIEVEQDGTGGKIVWEWHFWDHLIQDKDSTKPNFGVVANHPELLNINVTTSGSGTSPDWLHCNGIEYNADLDQIVFSSRYLSEIFIIDHSTSTAEAASHSGGNSGKGGDFLYRWGNPANYGAAFGVRTIPGPVHDVRWIKAGRPNAGYLQLFNNQGSSGNSTVDAINPPLVGFNYTAPTFSSGYLPVGYDWRHNCLANAGGQSASDRMPNGNTFVALSGEYMYEVDSLNNIVWQNAADPAKAFRYLCADSGIIALLGPNPCGLVALEEPLMEQISVFPNPSDGVFHVLGLNEYKKDFNVTVSDIYGRAVLENSNLKRIDLTNQANGVYFVTIVLNGESAITRKVTLVH